MHPARADDFTVWEWVGVTGVAAVAIVGATQTDYVGPILAFVGALLVAAIAAVTSSRRQAAQLRHARALADLDDLRALLDEAAVALHAASYASMKAQSRLLSFGGKIHERSPETKQEVDRAGEALDVLTARLTLRLGRDSPTVVAFRAAVVSLLEVSHALGMFALGHDERREEREEHEKVIDSAKQLELHRQEFEQAALALAGFQLP